MGGWQRILRPFFAMCPRTKAGVTVMCGSWEMCALKHTALVKFITWTTSTWATSFALWKSSDIYLCLQSVCLHSNWRLEMGVLKQPLASSKHLKDRRGPIPSNLYHVMRKEHRSRYTLAAMYKLCCGGRTARPLMCTWISKMALHSTT